MDTRDLRFLRHAHDAEVFGEATYGLLSRLDRGHRAAWEKLSDLERQTKADLAAALARLGPSPRESLAARVLGSGAAIVAAPLPWRAKLRGVQAVTALVLRLTRGRLDALAASDPELAARFEAHERAQHEYVTRELAGEPGALHAVVSLLAGAASGEA